MAKLGSVLMVLGGLMFFSFFFGIAYNIATPGDVRDHQAFRDNMDNHSRVAGTSFAVSAAGMLVGIAGAVMVAMSTGHAAVARIEETAEELEEEIEEEVVPTKACAHCGATLRARARKCTSCGAPA